jgi:hypothetical protein
MSSALSGERKAELREWGGEMAMRLGVWFQHWKLVFPKFWSFAKDFKMMD